MRILHLIIYNNASHVRVNLDLSNSLSVHLLTVATYLAEELRNFASKQLHNFETSINFNTCNYNN